ncbi:MAG: hypothetical protein ABW200_03170 [Hyphomicrobiaceae bacterium]|jgi:hypothetical protein
MILRYSGAPTQAARTALPLKCLCWRSKSHTYCSDRLLVGRKQPEGKALADGIMLGLLLFLGQRIAVPVQGSGAQLRLLQLTLVHELEQATRLAIGAGEAAALLGSSRHGALLGTPTWKTAKVRLRSARAWAGLQRQPMGRWSTTQAAGPSFPPHFAGWAGSNV